MKWHVFLIIVSLLSIYNLNAQDSLYFQTVNSKFIVKPNAVLQSYKLNIHSKNFKMIYKPDNSLNVGVYFSYKKIGLGIAYNLLNQDEKYIRHKNCFL